jgi:ComF family protein
LPADAELLVPVPLHRTRLWSRGFNQAALIAAAISRTSDVPSAPLLLRRRRRTAVLRGLGAAERARTVAGAFELAPAAGARLRDRHVVLVDDVYTSGATTDACIRALLRGGAARVTVLCWARVLDARDD